MSSVNNIIDSGVSESTCYCVSLAPYCAGLVLLECNVCVVLCEQDSIAAAAAAGGDGEQYELSLYEGAQLLSFPTDFDVRTPTLQVRASVRAVGQLKFYSTVLSATELPHCCHCMMQCMHCLLLYMCECVCTRVCVDVADGDVAAPWRVLIHNCSIIALDHQRRRREHALIIHGYQQLSVVCFDYCS